MIQDTEGKGPRLRTTEITLNCPLMVVVIEELKNISTRLEYKSYLAKYLGEFSCHVRDEETLGSNQEAHQVESEIGVQDSNQTGIELEAQSERSDQSHTLNDRCAKKLSHLKRYSQEPLLGIEGQEESIKRKLTRKKVKTSPEEIRRVDEISCSSVADTEYQKREQNLKFMLSNDRGSQLIDAVIGLYKKNTPESLQESKSVLSNFLKGDLILNLFFFS
jgi:hypothetical protein